MLFFRYAVIMHVSK